jgi:UDP-glucose 6-dehydrogenase
MKKLLDKHDIDSGILAATTQSNESHVDFQTDMLCKNRNVAEYEFENVCYKENSRIPLIEESAKLKIAKQLVQYGKKVVIYDYADIIVEVKKEFGNLFTYRVKEEPEPEPAIKGRTV